MFSKEHKSDLFDSLAFGGVSIGQSQTETDKGPDGPQIDIHSLRQKVCLRLGSRQRISTALVRLPVSLWDILLLSEREPVRMFRTVYKGSELPATVRVVHRLDEQ